MMITVIDDYFTKGCGRCDRFSTPECSTQKWRDGLEALRRICLGLQLEETVKWGHPCYMHAGRNIVIVGALRGDFRISFFNAALMKDPEGVLERPGPNTKVPDMIRFTQSSQVKAMTPILQSYLQEAMGYAASGIKPAKEATELELPVEMAEALNADPELAQAFYALTPGRQKSYVIHLNSTKVSQTRVRRIAKFRPHILANKGATER